MAAALRDEEVQVEGVVGDVVDLALRMVARLPRYP